MKWNPKDLAKERPDLQALAAFKYDGYQQFSPGMRFIESLALWLEQFTEDVERRVAYDFVRRRLVFISETEMRHLVAETFPHFLLPFLVNEAAKEQNVEKWRVLKILESKHFRLLLRQCVFLGLSDGSRIDLFRRSARPALSHEQILRTHEINVDRAVDMKKNLAKDMTSILGRAPSEKEAKFRIVFLLDDFSGSGISYIRQEGDGVTYKGKIAKFFEEQCKSANTLFDPKDLVVCLTLYCSTIGAAKNLEKVGKEMFRPIPFHVSSTYILPEILKLSHKNGEDVTFLEMLPKYYDNSIETDSYRKGRHREPYLGFDECALPLVLGHNTPNNSIPLLWFEENRKFRGLFPRVSRF